MHHYAASFTTTQVGTYPATVEVYCYQCLDDGNQERAGYVISVTQNSAGVPSEGQKWWKAGEFTWPSGSGSVRAKWTTCVTDCYSSSVDSTAEGSTSSTSASGTSGGSTPAASSLSTPAPTTAVLDITWQEMVSGAPISDVSYQIFSGYPVSFSGCNQSNSCGTLKSTSSSTSTSLSAGQYLIVASKTDYYTGYFTINLDSDGDSQTFKLVQEMSSDQDRVVLRWGHSEDLDLWVYDKSDLKKKVGWSILDKSASFAGGTMTLDVDVTNGPGVETTQFKSVSSGTIEVWVHHFAALFTTIQVGTDPATVEVYCYQCLDDSNQERAGYVISVTQNSTGVPSEGQKWWKAGEFTWPSGSGSVRAKWTTCVTDCYSSSVDSS